MELVDNFKRDIAQHRGRSAVLGALFVTMVVFSIRAVVQLQSSPAAIIPSAALAAQPALDAKISSSEAQSRIKESQELWAKLREVRPEAVPASVAFTFNPSYFPAPIVEMTRPPTTTQPDPVKVIIPQPMGESESNKITRIQNEARTKLVLKSTAVGEGVAQPVAIVNQQLLTVGQQVFGFTLTAIRSREIEVVKEGVTVSLSMANSQ